MEVDENCNTKHVLNCFGVKMVITDNEYNKHNIIANNSDDDSYYLLHVT